jgi:GT2 family glycosyltransferase
MDLSIITVTYQSKEIIDTCILSLKSHILSLEYEHIIIDNGSTDSTVAIIKESYSQPTILIENKKNEGFARACNQGLKIAKGRFVLFLNPDMQLCNGYLDDLIYWADAHKKLGIASCKLLSESKKPHHVLRPIKFPKLKPYFFSFLGLNPLFCTIHPSFFYPVFNDDNEQEVDVIRGAFMLIKKETLSQIESGFDEGYFLLFEDVDLCKQIKAMGLQVIYTPIVSCIDYFGQSFSQKSYFFKYFQIIKSFCRYVRKWHSPLHLMWIIPTAGIGYTLRYIKHFFISYRNSAIRLLHNYNRKYTMRTK